MPPRKPNPTTRLSGTLSANQKFASYVDVACNLDSLLWANQATLLGITVLGWGAIAITIEKRLQFYPLSYSQTLASILLLISCFYALTLIAKSRIRYWHLQVETELAGIEGSGYFSLRQMPKAWYLSAPRWTIYLFGFIAFLMLSTALALVSIPLATYRVPMEQISAQSAQELDGVIANHSTMENGERRFRLTTAEGNGYILTRSQQGGWQRSHSHDHVAETYVVEKGWMLFVMEGEPGAPIIVNRLVPGASVTTPVGRVHNVYLSPNAEIHTIKHGGRNGERDWQAHPEFDVITAALPLSGSATSSSKG